MTVAVAAPVVAMVAAPVARPAAMVGIPVAPFDRPDTAEVAIGPMPDLDIAFVVLLTGDGREAFGQIAGTIAAHLAVGPRLNDLLALDSNA